MDAHAEVEERLASRERIAVEQHLLGAAVARRAADHGMLPAIAIATEIGIRPVGRGHRGVVLLDAAPHLGKQCLPQSAGSRERRLRVGVLGLEIGADRGIEFARIAHHGLPVRRFQPSIIIDERDAVARDRDRSLLCVRYKAVVARLECGGVSALHDSVFRIGRGRDGRNGKPLRSQCKGGHAAVRGWRALASDLAPTRAAAAPFVHAAGLFKGRRIPKIERGTFIPQWYCLRGEFYGSKQKSFKPAGFHCCTPMLFLLLPGFDNISWISC